MKDEGYPPNPPDGTEHERGNTPSKRSSHNDPLAHIIAGQLRAARIAAGMTQEALGKPEFSKSYISALERGKILPSLHALSVLAERLSIPISYLLGELVFDLQTLKAKEPLLFSPPERASAALTEDPRLLLGKAEYLIRRDQPQEAWEILGGGIKPTAAWPLPQRPSWHWLVGWALRLLGRHAEAAQCLEQGLHLAESLRSRVPSTEHPLWDEMVERLRCFLGIVHCAQDEPTLALYHHRRGLEAIEQGLIRDPELKMLIYKGLGSAYFAFARYQEAISFYQKALECARDSNDKRQHGFAAWGLAVAYQQHGDLFRAQTRYQEALQALEEDGNQQWLAQVHAVFGLLLVNIQEYEAAEHHLNKSMKAARQLNDPRTTGLALAYFSSLHLARGELEQALQTARHALPLAQQSGDYRNMAHLHLVLASTYAARQDDRATEQALQEAIRAGEQTRDSDVLGQVHQRYADFLAEQQRYQEAYQELLLIAPTRAR